MTHVWNARFMLAALACSFAGCSTPSSIGVLFDVDLAVRGTRADGFTWQATSAEISKGKPSPNEFDPYGRTIFRNRDFEASFAVIKSGFGVELTNLTSTTICFRFDQARLSSNFEPVSKALRSGLVFRDGGYSGMTEAERKRNQDVGPLPMNKLCLAAGTSKPVYSFDTNIETFPSGMMFNIAYPKGSPVLNPDGVGNWAKLPLPIEIGSRREEFEFTLTAKQSRARASYW